MVGLEEGGAAVGGQGVMIEAFPVMTAIRGRSDDGERSNKREKMASLEQMRWRKYS